MSDQPATPPPDDTLARARERLLGEIDAEVARTAAWLGTDRLSPRVRAALGRVPRHRFVPERHRREAYANRPLPIGHGQTISQPYIVAVMTELAQPAPQERVLEIGTGCGYQTAVLAELAGRVYSIEAVAELYETARTRLAELGCANVELRRGDGSRGWPERAPFDAIVVTAAGPERVVHRLAAQLAPGGRLVIPVAREGGWGIFGGDEQDLKRIRKDRTGRLAVESLLPVAFVPLVSAGA